MFKKISLLINNITIIKVIKFNNLNEIINIIPKGFHYSYPRWLSIFKRDINKIKISFEIPSSSKYEFNYPDSGDINKLIGISYGIFGVHKNSIRLGWNIELGFPTLWLYYYNYNKRFSVRLRSYNFDTIYSITMSFRSDSVIVEGVDLFVRREYQYPTFPLYKFILQPYFGGNKTAPTKIKIPLWFKVEPKGLVS